MHCLCLALLFWLSPILASAQSLPSLPLGLPTPLPVPETNPLSQEKIDLGRRLFFDRRLSPNNTISCAMCHVPAQGFTVNEARLAVGMHGKTGKRNAPALYNVAYQELLFHDGREFTLEDQIIAPLTQANEMGNPSIGYVVNTIKKLPGYTEAFQAAFGEAPSVATLGKALASYQRTLVSANSPFDRWYYGREQDTLSEQAKLGFEIFIGKGKCGTCHVFSRDAALFTDHKFRNTGVAHLPLIPPKTIAVDLGGGLRVNMPRTQLDEVLAQPSKDRGRYEVTRDPQDLWLYKTPSLRNIALTAPYMHNGVLLTLEAVIDYYDRGGSDGPGQDARITPLHLTAVEKDALLAFLHSLTGDNVEQLAEETYPHLDLPAVFQKDQDRRSESEAEERTNHAISGQGLLRNTRSISNAGNDQRTKHHTRSPAKLRF